MRTIKFFVAFVFLGLSGYADTDRNFKTGLESSLLELDQGANGLMVYRTLLSLMRVSNCSKDEYQAVERYFSLYSVLSLKQAAVMENFLWEIGGVKGILLGAVGSEDTLLQMQESVVSTRQAWSKIYKQYTNGLLELEKISKCNIGAAKCRAALLNERMEQVIECAAEECNLILMSCKPIPKAASTAERKKLKEQYVRATAQLKLMDKRFCELARPMIVNSDEGLRNVYEMKAVKISAEEQSWPLM